MVMRRLAAKTPPPPPPALSKKCSNALLRDLGCRQAMTLTTLAVKLFCGYA